MSNKKHQLLCPVCGREFESGRRDAKTCSAGCRLKLYRREEKIRNQLVLSLFPGADLLGRAFEEAGFTVVRGPDVLWGGDIRRFHVPRGKFDGVIGGPPCQIFSQASRGRSKAVNLIPEFLRIVEEAAPTWVVMENVVSAVPAAPAWPAVTLNDYDCGGLTYRRRRFWFRGVTPPIAPPTRAGEPEYSVLASSWDSHGEIHGHNNLSAAEASRLQGFPDLGDRIMAAQPYANSALGLSPRGRNVLAVHLLGNGVPHAMGSYIAQDIKRQIQDPDGDREQYSFFEAGR